MTIIAGIDEAGYGPTLGPLVVAASAWRLDDKRSERTLNRLVQLKQDDGGLPIRDSKQLYNSGGTIARIEATTLGHAILARGSLPLRVEALLEHALDFHPGEARALPWYGKRLLDLSLPRKTGLDELLERTARQGELLTERGLQVADLFVEVVPEPRFNRLTTAAGSKAWTLFYAHGRLIEKLVATYPDEELVIHADRHGGRIHYAPMLQTFFPLAPLTTLHEKRIESAYELDWPGRDTVHIDFRIKADQARTPVALASVVAKTVRELFMESLNGWFAEQVADVRPTAGYPVDARRFLAEVGKSVDLDTHRDQLVRCR